MSSKRRPDCEISTSCSQSQKCPFTSQRRTVTPKDSNITLNCSIKTGEKVQDMTWQELEKHLITRNGLFVQQIDSTDGKTSCGCFPIKYASEYFLPLSLSPFVFVLGRIRLVITPPWYKGRIFVNVALFRRDLTFSGKPLILSTR